MTPLRLNTGSQAGMILGKMIEMETLLKCPRQEESTKLTLRTRQQASCLDGTPSIEAGVQGGNESHSGRHHYLVMMILQRASESEGYQPRR
jgi:hypothetical protein